MLLSEYQWPLLVGAAEAAGAAERGGVSITAELASSRNRTSVIRVSCFMADLDKIIYA